MSTPQKAAFAARALAITLAGAAFVTAPIAFARPIPIAAHSGCLVPGAHTAPGRQAYCVDLGQGSRLVALNRPS